MPARNWERVAVISEPSFTYELNVARNAALRAGAAILDYYNAQSAAVYAKSDGSAVTDADLAADKIIREVIGASFPDDFLLTEEGVDDHVRLAKSRIWIVDPIDGTNQFVNRTGEFEVLIALVVEGRPEVAVIYQPTGDVLITAMRGHGAWIMVEGQQNTLRFDPVPTDRAPRLLTSTWLGAPENVPLLTEVSRAMGGGEAIVSDVGITVRRFVSPESQCDILVGLHVDGKAGYAWEWDFAAPDLIMSEAGGKMTDLAGELHRYNKPDPVNRGGIVMSVDPATHMRVLEELSQRLSDELVESG